MTTIDFDRIRSAPKSRNDSFEALAVQLFRSSCAVPEGSTFVSLRGDGGDGGVEAYFRTPAGDVRGVQAKYFFKLDGNELGQIDDSLETALGNHPTLSQYWVYIPFDLTGRVAKGKRGIGQSERFEEWKARVEAEAEERGAPLKVTLCTAAVIRGQLLHIDPHGGRRRYWFDESVLTRDRVQRSISEAVAFAGPRYTGALDVGTNAHDGLDFFGGTGDFDAWREESLQPILDSIRRLRSSGEESLDILGDRDAAVSRALVESLLEAAESMTSLSAAPAAVTRLNEMLAKLLPLLQKAREAQEAAFNATHGAEKDTPNFRQVSAELMCNFPAGAMDSARDWEAEAYRLKGLLESGNVGAAVAKSMLLVGPAGIGKTHAIVSAAIRRLEAGGFSLVVFGDDFGKAEPWEVLRTKLGFGASVGQDELFECLQAGADHSRLPFVIYIDALNESPRNARWKSKLPELLAQCNPYPGIRVCVSTRDTYRDLVVDSRFPGFAFEHSGFAGQEFEAVQAFAEFYGLDAEITPLFSPELSNPLFLHLACKTLKDEGRTTLDVALPGFSALFEGHLRHCDGLVRDRLHYVNPKNLVRAAMLLLADTLTHGLPQERTWEACTAALKGLTGGDIAAAEGLLKELEHEGLIILSAGEEDSWLVRMGYQRYGDLLRATSLIEASMGPASLDVAALAAKLTLLGQEDRGLLEALAAVLPEKTGVEITVSALGLPPEVAHELFINALTWRSRSSVTARVEKHVMAALLSPGLWVRVYDVFFRMSIVPEHRLNARHWLHPFLRRAELAPRDAFLSVAVARSYSDHGAVWSLINAALKADIARWPAESRKLAALTLAWLSAASDRRVRDQSSKALARVISMDPGLGRELAQLFEDCDDDYVLESIALATYSACLLTPERKADFIPALDGLLMITSDTTNVLVRDSVRLLADFVRAAGIPSDVSAKLEKYPSKASLPAQWPTLPDAQPLLTLQDLPSNMELWGSPLGPDFWRYQVESKIRSFDLKKAGITHENIACWLMVEVLRLGYPGPQGCALRADHLVLSDYGGGRGREGFAERLGKKYYWILLHRLLGILADNVEPKQEAWSERRPGPGHLWSVDVRKADISDVRDISPSREYPDELLKGPRYPFPERTSPDIKKWVALDDFTPHGECIVRTTAAGDDWVALSMSARDSDTPPNSDSWSKEHLGVDVYYTSVFVERGANVRFGGDWDVFGSSQGASCYRGYFAEYPDGKVFSQLLEEGAFNTGSKGLRFSDVTLMRGGEWQYDFSYTTSERPDKLTVPCQEVVRGLGLRWDRQRGWVDANGELVAFETSAKRRSALFIKRSSLNQYLRETGQRLVYRRFATRGLYDMRGTTGSQIDLFAWLEYLPDDEPKVFQKSRRPFNC